MDRSCQRTAAANLSKDALSHFVGGSNKEAAVAAAGKVVDEVRRRGAGDGKRDAGRRLIPTLAIKDTPITGGAQSRTSIPTDRGILVFVVPSRCRVKPIAIRRAHLFQVHGVGTQWVLQSKRQLDLRNRAILPRQAGQIESE